MPRSSAQAVVRAGDSALMDAFGRARVSNPVTIFDSKQRYGDSDLFWEYVVTGTGTVANSLPHASVILSNGGTAAGASAYRQSKMSALYQPGKSQLIVLTGVFTSGAVSGVRRRYGLFDADNGAFLQLDGSTLSVVLRSSVTGAPVDRVVPQSAWADRLDGTGPSGLTLDVSKAFILAIDLQWLGMGRVRFGFDINGVFVPVYAFNNANNLSTVYMSTADLPIRAEVYNTGTAGAIATLQQTCASIIAEGGVDDAMLLQFSANRGITPLAVTTQVPVISLRAATTGPNGVRNVGHILPRTVDLMAASNPCRWSLILNPTLTGAAFAKFSASYSLAEVDTTASAVSGGIVIASGFIPAGGAGTRGSETAGLLRKLPLVYSGLKNVQDVLTLAATSISGTSSVNAAITWQEAY